jgi:hypothetical protein
MRVYKLHPEYTPMGGCYAHWVDDGVTLMDTPQDRVGSVLDQWPTDLEFPVDSNGFDCDVFFNPCGLIFSQESRDLLSDICGDDAEWLPMSIIDYGTMYIFHPVRIVSLGSDARYRQHNPGDNIVEIYDHDFDDPDSLPSCFLIPQPSSSAAGKNGAACSGVFVTNALREAMSQYRGVDFACVFESPTTN